MPYQLNRRPESTVEVTAELGPEKVEAERLHILRDVRRSARIPGFRPGKAPLAMVKARFSGTVEEELLKHLSADLWTEVVEGEEDLRAVTGLQVKDTSFAEDGSFHMTGTIEVRPQLELGEPEELDLPPFSIEVSEAEVEEEINKLRREQAAWEPAEDTPAEDGMLAELDIRGEYADGEGEPFTSEGVRFVLGEEGVFPEIQEALQGVKAGEERTAERRFPEDDPEKERAGRRVAYTLVVHSVKRQVLPELDDEFARGFGFDELAGLEERARDAIGSRKRGERRSAWRRSLLDQLTEGFDLNQLPPTLVGQRLREELERYGYMLAMQGRNPSGEDVDWQRISAELEPSVRRAVLDNLVLDELAEAWQVEVPEDDVAAYLRKEAHDKGVPPAEHAANLEKEGQLEQIRKAARLSAALDELIRRAGGEVA